MNRYEDLIVIAKKKEFIPLHIMERKSRIKMDDFFVFREDKLKIGKWFLKRGKNMRISKIIEILRMH